MADKKEKRKLEDSEDEELRKRVAVDQNATVNHAKLESLLPKFIRVGDGIKRTVHFSVSATNDKVGRK